MRKREFMNRLAQLLTDIPYEERIEALQYYEDYFADAGDDKEQDVIAELKSPERLADIIKKEIAGGLSAVDERFNYPEAPVKLVNSQEAENGQYQGNMDQGFYHEGYQEQFGKTYQDQDAYRQNDYINKKKKMTGGKLALLITGAIFLGPVLIGIFAALFGVVISIFAVIGSLFLVFAITGAVLIIAGIIFIGFGIVNIFVSLPRGVLLAGAGLVLFGTGFLFIAVSILLVRSIKWVFNKTINGLNGLFNKRRAYA